MHSASGCGKLREEQSRRGYGHKPKESRSCQFESGTNWAESCFHRYLPCCIPNTNLYKPPCSPLLPRTLSYTFLRMPARPGAPSRQNSKDQHHVNDRLAQDTRNSRSGLLPPFVSRSDRKGTWRSLSRRTQRALMALLSFVSLLLLYFLLYSGKDHSRPVATKENGDIPVHAPAAKFAPPKPHNPHGHQHAAARATVTHTETVFVTQTAVVPAPTTTSVATYSADPVVFVFIMISVDSASEGAILLKVC